MFLPFLSQTVDITHCFQKDGEEIVQRRVETRKKTNCQDRKLIGPSWWEILVSLSSGKNVNILNKQKHARDNNKPFLTWEGKDLAGYRHVYF